jgi:hypothetical protein
MKKLIFLALFASGNTFASQIVCTLRVDRDLPLQEGASRETIGLKSIALSNEFVDGKNLTVQVIDQAKFRITRFENDIVSAQILQDIKISKKQTSAFAQSLLSEEGSLEVGLDVDTIEGQRIMESIKCSVENK